MDWRPMEEAPKDGTPVLLKMRGDIYPLLRPNRPDLEQWNGSCAVMCNYGDRSVDWGFAAPVGHGGFPDDWFVGWKPVEG